MNRVSLSAIIFISTLFSSFLASATAIVAAPNNCEIKTHRLTSGNWVTRLVSHHTQQVVDMQTDWANGLQTVHIAIDGVYYGEYGMPADFGGMLATHELGFVHEPGNDGRLQLKQRVIPVVNACSSWSKIDNTTLDDSAIREKE